MKNYTTGLVDIPLKSFENDKLKIESFELALIDFISNTSTPMTVALQGEWGSGKTSLMNRLQEKLCNAENSEFYNVWLNTWQYSLIADKDVLLQEILIGLINQIIEITKKEHPEKLKTLINDVYNIGKNIFKGITKVALKAAVSQVSESAADSFGDEFFGDKNNSKYSIKDLRDKLSELINENIVKNKEKDITKRAFVFFIDDLDRIEPKIAVNILELMKNIFDIENCIFVLAIDYDVVVKGLKDKFGDLNEENEREFRSFFDKIIQLPFQMPVSSYIVDDYLKDQLLELKIISEKEAQNTDFIESIVSITVLSVGTNPRSIKRLINTISFINLLLKSKSKINKSEFQLLSFEKQMIYSLICLQTGYPQIYNLLTQNADIENWNEKFAQKHNIKLLDVNSYKLDVLDKKWKQILFVFCEKNPYLKKHFYSIVSIFNKIQEIAEENNQSISEILPKTIDLLSVTNVKNETKPILEINTIRVLYALNQKLLPELQKNIREPFKMVERKGRMIANLKYKFDDNKFNTSLSIFIYTIQNNIYLKFGTAIELFNSPKNSEVSFQNFERFGKTEQLAEFFRRFEIIKEKNNDFSITDKFKNGLFVENKTQKFKLEFQTSTQDVELFYTTNFINNLSKIIIDYMNIIYEMKSSKWI